MLQEVLNLGALASGNAVVQIISIILGILLYLYKDEIKAFAKSKGIFKDIARILKLSDRVRKDLKILATALEDGKITPDEAIELAKVAGRLAGLFDDFEEKNGDYVNSE